MTEAEARILVTQNGWNYSALSKETGISLPVVKKILTNPDGFPDQARAKLLCEALNRPNPKVIVHVMEVPEKEFPHPIIPAKKMQTEEIDSLKKEVAELRQFQKDAKKLQTEQEIQNRIETACRASIANFCEGKVILEFKSGAQASYINDEIIPQALAAGVIKTSGDLLVIMLSIAQGSIKQERVGYVPESGTLMQSVK